MATQTEALAPPAGFDLDRPRVRSDQPRIIQQRAPEDVFARLGSMASALALVWVVYDRLLGWEGWLGFGLCWFATFVAMYAGVTSLRHPAPIVRDRIWASIVAGGAALVGLGLASAVVYVFGQGLEALRYLNFYTEDMAGVGPTDPLSVGGAIHAIVGSIIEITIAVVVTLPLGVGTAVFMTEVGGPFARIVRTIVEAMTALPSIVAGLFIYTVLIVELGFPRTGFTAAMAISVMMLPIIARAADVELRVVPGGLREAGLALGATQWRTVMRVVLPTARAGLATALILGVARGIGETSPVLLTSGASTFLNVNPFVDPMNSLPLFVFSLVRSGQPEYIARAFGAAAFLLALVLLLFALTRLLARQRKAPSR